MLKTLAAIAALTIAGTAQAGFITQDYNAVHDQDGTTVPMHIEFYETNGVIDYLSAVSIVTPRRSYTLNDIVRVSQHNVFFSSGWFGPPVSAGQPFIEQVFFEAFEVNRRSGPGYFFTVLRESIQTGVGSGGGRNFIEPFTTGFTSTYLDIPTPAIPANNFTFANAWSAEFNRPQSVGNVPLPGSIALLGLGMAGFGLRSLRKQQS